MIHVKTSDKVKQRTDSVDCDVRTFRYKELSDGNWTYCVNLGSSTEVISVYEDEDDDECGVQVETIKYINDHLVVWEPCDFEINVSKL